MILIIIKLILVALCGLFWKLGGQAGFSKGFRRYGCAGLLLINTILMRHWIGILSFPLNFAAHAVGYGKNSKLTVWLKNKYLVRFVCGLLYGCSDIFILWGNWWLLGFHIGILSLGVTLAGNQKFQLKDREEAFIGVLRGLCPILS